MSQPNQSLAELAALLGEHQAREVVRSFISAYPGMLRDLSSGDRQKQRRTAHSLKSTSRQMGANELSDLMAAMELRLGSPGETVTPADLAQVAKVFSAAAGPLRAYAGM